MKTLLLVRHAKSSWSNQDLTDYERPLNKRGFKDAPFMGKLLASKDFKPDLIISSSAVRAATTAKLICKEISYSEEMIRFDEKIYSSSSKYIVRILEDLPDELRTVAIFGHNPDITFLASYFSGEYFDNVPTAGIVCIDFDFLSWKNIENQNGKLRFFEIPKKYSEADRKKFD